MPDFCSALFAAAVADQQHVFAEHGAQCRDIAGADGGDETFEQAAFRLRLAFERGAFDNLVATRIGVLVGALLAATPGVGILWFSGRTRNGSTQTAG